MYQYLWGQFVKHSVFKTFIEIDIFKKISIPFYRHGWTHKRNYRQQASIILFSSHVERVEKFHFCWCCKSQEEEEKCFPKNI